MIFLLFILIIALLAIFIGYQLTHAPEMTDDEAESRAQQEEEDFTDV